MSVWPSSIFAGRHYAVCGLGRNGTSVVQALLSMGASVHAWDDHNPSLPEHPRLTLAPLTDLNDMDALILSPGIPHALPEPHPAATLALSQNIPILSDAEILWQAVRRAGSQARFISITGTNGKSTTTTLLTHILNQAHIPTAAGGNLGTASLALPLLGHNGVYILEMSSYMLERLQHYHAHAAALLNLTPDHLERHGSMEGYLHAKSHVFDNMAQGDLAILGENASWSHMLEQTLSQRSITVNTLTVTHPYPKKDAPFLPGIHNAQNIQTSRLIAQHLGVPNTTINTAIRTFTGLAHRLQKVASSQGIDFINDSKATNAEATQHALQAYPHVIWIAGGTAKSGGIDSLTPYFARIRHAFLIGKDAEILAKTLEKHHIPFTIIHTLEKAVPAAWNTAHQTGTHTILLSPACASFDQFHSFEHRGDVFTQIARTFNDTCEE